jgi:hypothetical protein
MIPMFLFSQSVEVGNHVIHVDSKESQEVLYKYIEFMNEHPVTYESNLIKLREVKVGTDASRDRVAEYRDGIIYLNPRLDEFPNIKKATILHYVLIDNGMQELDIDKPHVLGKSFNMSKNIESKFKSQFTDNRIFGWIVRETKKLAPLKATL